MQRAGSLMVGIPGITAKDRAFLTPGLQWLPLRCRKEVAADPTCRRTAAWTVPFYGSRPWAVHSEGSLPCTWGTELFTDFLRTEPGTQDMLAD